MLVFKWNVWALCDRAGDRHQGRVRRWLRREWRAGNPPLADHRHGERWWFSSDDARELAEQYKAYRAAHPLRP